MNTTELLHRVSDIIPPEQLAGVEAVIQYQLETPVYHEFRDGTVQAVTGVHEAPDVTVIISEKNIRRLLAGDLRLGRAVFTGRLRVRGDLLLAQRLLGLVDRTALAELLDQEQA